MRPLTHPPAQNITVEGILHALADSARVAIYAEIVNSQVSQNCSCFLTVNEREIPKSTLSQHFRILREAGLIRSERVGVEVQNTSRCEEIEEKFHGLIAAIVNAHYVQSAARKKPKRVDNVGKSKPAPAKKH